MEGLTIACAKCGEGIHVDKETIDEMVKMGVPLRAAHEVCPQDAKVFPKYRFAITVTRIDPETGVEHELARVGDTVEAPSFAAALPSITAEVNKQWDQVNSYAVMAEADLD